MISWNSSFNILQTKYPLYMCGFSLFPGEMTRRNRPRTVPVFSNYGAWYTEMLILLSYKCFPLTGSRTGCHGQQHAAFVE